MNAPESPKWQETQGIGSAEYFGQFLGALRQYKGADSGTWASTAGIDPERYQQFETGAIDTPPSLDELNDWSARWQLTRDEIIYLKISGGGYDNSVSDLYVGDLTADDLKRGIEAILEDQPRFHLLRFVWDLAMGYIACRFTRKSKD